VGGWRLFTAGGDSCGSYASLSDDDHPEADAQASFDGRVSSPAPVEVLQDEPQQGRALHSSPAQSLRVAPYQSLEHVAFASCRALSSVNTRMEVLGWMALGALVGAAGIWVYFTDQSTRIRQLLAGLGLLEDPRVRPQPSPS
jgi:hypothetical protein